MASTEKACWRIQGSIEDREKGRVFLLYSLVLLAFVAASRTLALNADSVGALFGVYYGDEGIYGLSPKNLLLTGSAVIGDDNWDSFLISPASSVLLYPVFDVFGISQWSGRLPFVITSLLSVVLFLVWISRHKGGRTALAIALAFAFSFDHVMFFYARAALAENVQILLFLLYAAILCQFKGPIRFALAGAILPLVAVGKMSALPTAVLSLSVPALLIYGPGRDRSKGRCIGLFLAGLVLATVVIFAFFQDADLSKWVYLNFEIQRGKLPHDVLGLLRTLGHFVGRHQWIDDNPFHLLVLLEGLFICCSRLRTLSRVGRFELVMMCWLLLEMALDCVLGADVRRTIFVHPIGYAFVLFHLFEEKTTINGSYLTFLIGAGFGFVLLAYVSILAGLMWYHHWASMIVWLFAGILHIGVTTPERWKRRTSEVPSSLPFSLLLVFCAISGLWNISKQFTHPSYTIEEALDHISGKIDPGTAVYGEPWFFLGLARPMKFVNCSYANADAMRELPEYVMSRQLRPGKPHTLSPCFEEFSDSYVLEHEYLISVFDARFSEGPDYSQRHLLYRLERQK